MKAASQFKLLTQRRFAPYFVTQLFGAMNDHLFKSAIAILITFGIASLSSADVGRYLNLAQLLFIGPFVLLSAMAGQLVEKMENSKLIRWIKLLEILIMTVGLVGFHQQSVPILLTALCMMGVHSTFFSTVKYSILPQLVRAEELVGGNALIESSTTMVILIGSMLGISIAAKGHGAVAVGYLAIGLAVLGYLAARRIEAVPATAPDLKLSWDPFGESWRNLGYVRRNRTVFLSVLGISWYWFYGATLLTELPNYTKLVLGGNQMVVATLMLVFSVGVGVGSLLCERLSGHKVEIGLVPLGSIGMTLFGVDLYYAAPGLAAVEGQTVVQFLHLVRNHRVLWDLMLLGVFSGFYVVPLYALIQSRSEPSHRARIIAGNNILNAAFTLVSAALAWGLLKAGLTIPQLLLTVALMNAAVALFIYSLVPEFLMRFLVWMLINTLYRIDERGLDNIPEEGGAIVACNHVSFVDALIVGGTIRRPVRFVMYYKIFRIPVLHFIFRTARAIPIAGAKEDPRLLSEAFEEIDRALKNGELIGIFPEGGLTPDGDIKDFRNGIERVIARTPVPVVPMALRGLWNGMWSRRDSRMGRMRLPRRMRAHIDLIAGAVVPSTQVTAAGLEAKVRELRGAEA